MSRYGYRYGRQAAQRPVGYRDLAFYLSQGLPQAANQFDPLNGASPFRMLGNGPDPSLTVNGGQPAGDCGFVMTVNANIVTAAALGEAFAVPSSDEVVTDYLRYDRGQDVGVANAQLLPFWRKVGLWGNRIKGSGGVNFRDFDEAMAYNQAFLGLCTGIFVSEADEDATANGEPWDYTGSAANQNILGGHDVYVFGRADADTVILGTWGQRQLATRRWWAQQVEECDAVVTAELAQKGADTLGLDVESLEADLARQ